MDMKVVSKLSSPSAETKKPKTNSLTRWNDAIYRDGMNMNLLPVYISICVCLPGFICTFCSNAFFPLFFLQVLTYITRHSGSFIVFKYYRGKINSFIISLDVLFPLITTSLSSKPIFIWKCILLCLLWESKELSATTWCSMDIS